VLEIWHETDANELSFAHEFMDMSWDEFQAWVERSGIWNV